MKVNEPYLPEITLEDILAFDPNDEQTYTSSRLVNAVAYILSTTQTRDVEVFVNRLQLDKRHISSVIEVEMGMTLKDLIVQYRLAKMKQFIASNPDMTRIQIAQQLGFSSAHALWRFFQTHTGETVMGVKSEAPRVDNYHQMVKRIRKNR